ncbi:glycine betaine ABC transporter substrate-binding protein [Clostridium algidicarnis]|uniref:glycine betaine ABC transporter substrate-binding protein n=1 Tax=Clostridium algidicarnis TaxID=37659 RepID=UPI001C0ADA0F|nr:glycine betaine ABC transporter substrate-binding protein [Clostridium algidicarnis]MBU3227326.1 glycine betaine ABC transporter substrate-binding protein [Clostridium algidicarnis]MBU3250849.1 glycine betaine ABC transporter substrate-binding protein [Clostridium algidicarnis]
MFKNNKKSMIMVLVLGMALTILTGCGKKEATIKVGSKEFSEQLLLGQMTILALEDAGYKVEDKTGVAGSDKVRSALKSEEIDIYWEYTGTAWLSHLQHDNPLTDSKDCYEQVKAGDASNGIEWLNYAPLNNTYTVMMRKEQAEELGINTLTQLGEYISANPDELRFAVDHEFTSRGDGLPGLEESYKFKMKEDNLLVMDNGIVYKALKEKQADIGMGFSTDGRIKGFDLVNIKDDLNFFPAYNPSPNLRADFAKENPKVVEILNTVSEKIDTETMTKLNYSVDIEQRVPKDVAKEWMKSQGLIK